MAGYRCCAHKCHFSNRHHSGDGNCAREYAVVHSFYGLFTIIISTLSSGYILCNVWISKHRLLKDERVDTQRTPILCHFFFFFSISIAHIVNSKCSSHEKWLAQHVKFQDGDMTLNESIPDLDLTILSVDTSVIMPD